jgi:uncharacterized protein
MRQQGQSPLAENNLSAYMVKACSIADGHPIDLERLLETRMLVQANSGGGKSWALRRILEQTAPKVQQLVIDPEGEFSTLREKFDYVICAPHDADAIATPRTAALLARRLLETGVSAILDIYDLKAHERQAFVEKFLTTLVNAPKALWRPVLIVLDEAHVFAPEKGHAESTGAVIDVATRGRKRGQSLIVATQRLAKLHKDVAAEMLNKMIGRTGLDNDVQRAADELGLTKREGFEQLRPLDPGEFYIFGPALSTVPKKVKVGDVVTTHPKAGARLMHDPPAPSAKIKGLIAAELADLPQQAESEIRTLEDLKKENANLKRSLTAAQKAQPAQPEDPKLREENKGLRTALKTATDAFKQVDARLRKIAALADVQSPDIAAPAPVAAAVVRFQPRPASPKPRVNGHAEPSGDVTRPQQKLLDQLAWLEEHGIYPAQKETLAAVAGVSPTSGGYFNNLGALRSLGLIEYPQPGTVGFTDDGRACAVSPDDPRPVHERWLSVVSGPQRAILEALIELHPDPISKDELAERIGVSPTSGGYFNNLGRLRTLGAVDYPQPGSVALTTHVMPN